MPKPKKQVVKKAPADHVVRCWESSPILYGWDSRDRQANPNHHETIKLTNTGRFVNEAGRELEKTEIPTHILEQAKETDLDITYHAPAKQELTLEQAMRQAGVRA